MVTVSVAARDAATSWPRWTTGALPRRPGLNQVLVRPCSGHEVAHIRWPKGWVARLLQRAEGDFVQIAPAHLHRPCRELRGVGGVVPLTPTGAYLLQYLARRWGRVVTVPELVEQVWGFPTGGHRVCPHVQPTHRAEAGPHRRSTRAHPQLSRLPARVTFPDPRYTRK